MASAGQHVKWLTVACFMGLVFGFAMQKGRVYDPVVIVRQFRAQDWTMFKMWMGAAAASLLANALVSTFDWKGVQITRRDNFVLDRGYVATTFGLCLLGAGMAIGGACPGTVLIQLGAGGVPSAWITLCGAMTAAFVYGLTHDQWAWLRRKGSLTESQVALERIVYGPKAGRAHFGRVCVALASVFLSLVVLIEWLAPDAAPLLLLDPAAAAWHPITTGLIVGSLQAVGIFFLRQTLGSATSYMIVMANACNAAGCGSMQWMRKPHHQALLRWRDPSVYWQPLFLGAAVLGAALSVHASGHVSGPLADAGVSASASFLGGFLIVYGARIAGGCTSGAGLSGTGSLSVKAVTGCAAIFGSALITGLLLQ